MSYRTYCVGIGFLIFGLIRPPIVAASRSIRIVTAPFTLISDQPQEIIASASGFDDGELVHIKGALYRDGSTNYFGYTENGGVWVKNSAPTETQRSVDMSTWDGSLRVRADFEDSGYSGDGPYFLKIRFYYGENGSQWSENSVSVTLVAPTATVTPVPTPSPTTKQIEPTSMPSVTPSATPTSIVLRPTVKSAPRTDIASASAILGIQASSNRQASYQGQHPVDAISIEAPDSQRVRILLSIGMVCGIGSAVLAYIQFGVWKKRHEQKKE